MRLIHMPAVVAAFTLRCSLSQSAPSIAASPGEERAPRRACPGGAGLAQKRFHCAQRRRATGSGARRDWQGRRSNHSGQDQRGAGAKHTGFMFCGEKLVSRSAANYLLAHYLAKSAFEAGYTDARYLVPQTIRRRITPGARADLVIVEGNPLNIELTRGIVRVFKNGFEVSRALPLSTPSGAK